MIRQNIKYLLLTYFLRAVTNIFLFFLLARLLSISDYGVSTPIEIWPEENNIDALLEYLGKLKLLRFDEGIAPNILYPEIGTPSPIENLEGYDIRVKGNPNLANIKTIVATIINKYFT